MRADMAKVIVERPRLKQGYRKTPKGYKKQNRRMIERDGGTPIREGIKRPYGWATKTLNEHLGPLRRYLDSQVGRPWNKVFEEICERIDRNNPVQDHVRDHVQQYVIRNVTIIDGVLCHGGGSFWRIGTPLAPWYLTNLMMWYVCPKTDLLRRVPPYRKPASRVGGSQYPFPNRVNC